LKSSPVWHSRVWAWVGPSLPLPSEPYAMFVVHCFGHTTVVPALCVATMVRVGTVRLLVPPHYVDCAGAHVSGDRKCPILPRWEIYLGTWGTLSFVSAWKKFQGVDHKLGASHMYPLQAILSVATEISVTPPITPLY
jgi:hypothetical protein